MIDGMKFYEKSKLKDGDFVKVKGNQVRLTWIVILKKLSVLTTGL